MREAADALEAILSTEVTDDMVRAASESQAVDDEGVFPPLCDMIDCSGENKTRTVVRAALSAALAKMWGRDADPV